MFNKHNGMPTDNFTSNHNDKYVNFMCPINLAKYLAELTKQVVEYRVIKETDGSHSVAIVGF